MAEFQPPPTYELPVRVEEQTDAMGRKSTASTFSPIWLKWFIDLAQVLSSAGASAGSIDHNSTTGKQGGAAPDFYHLTAAEYAALAAGSSSDVLANRAFRQVYTPPLAVVNDSQNVLANQVFGG